MASEANIQRENLKMHGYSRHQQNCYGWPTRIGFGASMGGWLAAVLWFLLRSAYAGVFVVGFCLGLYLLENWQLHEALREESEKVVELEKQVVGLRSVVNELSLFNSEVEAERRRDARFRGRPTRGSSASSL